MQAIVKQCKCKHTQQDSIYGPGERLHNPLKPKDKGSQQYRCTVCGTVS